MNDSTPASRPTRVRYIVLAWFCSLALITYVDRACISQVGQEMGLDLNLIPALVPPEVADKLQLTDEQKEKLAPLQKEYQKAVSKVRQEVDDENVAVQRITAVQVELEPKLLAILNGQQKDDFEELKKNFKPTVGLQRLPPLPGWVPGFLVGPHELVSKVLTYFNLDPFVLAAFTTFFLAYSIFEVPIGWMGDRYGPRKVLVRIVVWWLIFTALTGLVTGFYSLLVVRFLFGAGEAGAVPNISRAARNWFGYEERGFMQGSILLFMRWGGAIAFVLMYGLAMPFGWRWGFVILGVLGIVWAVGFYYSYRDTPQEHSGVNEAELAIIGEKVAAPGPPAPMSWITAFSSPTMYWICLMYMSSSSAWVFFITLIPPYLEDEFKLKGLWLSLAAGVPLIFGGIACVVGGWFTDRLVRSAGRRWGRTLPGIIAYGSSGLCFSLAAYLTWVNNLHGALAALCLAAFTKDLGLSTSWTTTIDVGHRYSGTISGFMNMMGNLGAAISPLIVAWLVENAKIRKDMAKDWIPALLFSMAMCFLAALSWFFINPRHIIVYSPADQERLRAEGLLE